MPLRVMRFRLQASSKDKLSNFAESRSYLRNDLVPPEHYDNINNSEWDVLSPLLFEVRINNYLYTPAGVI